LTYAIFQNLGHRSEFKATSENVSLLAMDALYDITYFWSLAQFVRAKFVGATSCEWHSE